VTLWSALGLGIGCLDIIRAGERIKTGSETNVGSIIQTAPLPLILYPLPPWNPLFPSSLPLQTSRVTLNRVDSYFLTVSFLFFSFLNPPPINDPTLLPIYPFVITSKSLHSPLIDSLSSELTSQMIRKRIRLISSSCSLLTS